MDWKHPHIITIDLCSIRVALVQGILIQGCAVFVTDMWLVRVLSTHRMMYMYDIWVMGFFLVLLNPISSMLQRLIEQGKYMYLLYEICSSYGSFEHTYSGIQVWDNLHYYAEWHDAIKC